MLFNAPDTHLVPFDGRFAVDDFATAPAPDGPSKSELKAELADLVEQLHELQRVLFADGRYALLAVFQAMDAAGKDSTIRKVFSGVNPAGIRTTAFGAPSSLERSHEFLWRCVQRLPERGKIGIFNRSHYEEVLVVRVKPELLTRQRLPRVAPETIWDERLESIRNWELHLARNGVVVVKFWLHLSPEEQKRRFLRRIEQPDKNWKFVAEDLEDRRRWDVFMHAYQDMLRQTSREHAPWYAIPADWKPYTRVAVARTLVQVLSQLDLAWPGVDERQQQVLAQSRAELLAETESPAEQRNNE
ncbi:MAG: polyphosphate kinase 2 family protein [Wenzhouxiangellaceae bacterium]|nr:polyphosphate kinase 2 family protein [Wenzhouxiangellaceae bacterium]